MIFIECDKCKFRDIPENFNAFMSYAPNTHVGESGTLLLITIECPVCSEQQFYQHFKVGGEMQVTNTNVVKYTFSHKIYPHEILSLPQIERGKKSRRDIKVTS